MDLMKFHLNSKCEVKIEKNGNKTIRAIKKIRKIRNN